MALAAAESRHLALPSPPQSFPSQCMSSQNASIWYTSGCKGKLFIRSIKQAVLCARQLTECVNRRAATRQASQPQLALVAHVFWQIIAGRWASVGRPCCTDVTLQALKIVPHCNAVDHNLQAGKRQRWRLRQEPEERRAWMQAGQGYGCRLGKGTHMLR
jgi:hypothetical protein